MAKKKGDITFGIKFQTDNSGLNQLKTQLQQLQNLTVGDLINTKGLDNAEKELNDIKKSAQAVEKALEKSFNAKLNTYNLSAFEKEVKKSQGSVAELLRKWQQANATGAMAANNLTDALVTNNKHIKQSSELLDKMAETMANTVRWSIASSALNAMTGSVQRAWSFTKQLDTSLNDIMIVTEKSADDMARFAKSANIAAKNLGAVTTDYTKAALIYYQQGLGDEETAARAATTVKVANVTKQSADTASEQLTAIWNGYKVSAQEAELYIDKVSAVAATTAADLEELATGMSKVASAANIMGVDIDQLNAQIATIVSVTREAPESIGTALKTVYARMSDIQAGLDEETSYDEYTKQMLEMGINVLDAKNNLRDMGDVVEEIGEKWNTMNRNQQVALAQTIAGTRQYSRMMSLFDNWDMYESAKMTSENSMGALQAQNEEYLESMEAHLAGLTAQAEELYMALFDAEDINPLIDALTNIVGLFTNMIDVMGGAKGMLMGIGGLGMAVFGDKIASGIGKTASNVHGFFTDVSGKKAQQRIIDELAEGNPVLKAEEDTLKRIAQLKQNELKYERFMNEEQKKEFDTLFKEQIKLENKTIELKEQEKLTKQIAMNLKSGAGSLSTSAQGAVIANQTGELQDSADFYKQAAAEWAGQRIVLKQDAFDKYTPTINKIQKEINQNQGVLKRTKDTEIQEEYKIKISKLEKELARIQLEQSRYATPDTQEMRSKIIKDAELIQQAFKKTGTSIFSKKEQKELDVLITKVKAIKDTSRPTKEEVEILNKAIRQMAEISGKAEPELKKLIQGADGLKKELDEVNKKAKDGEKGITKFFKQFDGAKLASGFTSIAGGAMSATFAIQGLTNTISAWGDESLSTGERVTQVISGLVSVAGTGYTSFIQLKKGFTDLSDVSSKAASKIGMSGGQMVGSIMAVVAIATVAGIAVGIIIDNWENKLQKTYETLSKAADEAKQRLNESNLEWNQLLSSFERLEGLKNDLNDLTDGTVEWRKAIADINAEVTELITKYPELAQFVSRGKDGEMTISAAGQAYLKEAQMEEINRNSFAAASARQRANEANIEARRKDFNEEYRNGFEITTGGAVGGTVAGTAIGAGIGTVIAPVIGTVIGAAIGALIGGAGSAFLNWIDEDIDKQRLKDDRAATDKVLEKYLTHGDKIFESETALAEALDKSVDDLTDLERAMLENTEETKALAEAYKAERLAEYQNILDMGYALGAKTEGEAALLGQKAENLQNSEDYSAEAMKKKYDGGNDKDMEAAREYARLAGIKVETLTAKGFNKVQLNGEEFSMDEIYQLLAPLKAFEAAQGLNLKDISNITGKFSENELDDFAAIISGDPNTKSFTGLTQEEFKNLATLTDAEWSQLAEELREDVDVLKERFDDAIDETGDAWEALMEDMTPQAAELFEAYRDSFGNMGLGQQQTVANTFDKITSRYGLGEGEEFLKALANAGEQQDEVADIIGNTDWSQYDSTDIPYIFKEALEKAKIFLEPEDIATLTESIQQASDKVVKSLSNLQNFNSFSDQALKILSENGTIDTELKDKLINEIPALEKYIFTNDRGISRFMVQETDNIKRIILEAQGNKAENNASSGFTTLVENLTLRKSNIIEAQRNRSEKYGDWQRAIKDYEDTKGKKAKAVSDSLSKTDQSLLESSLNRFFKDQKINVDNLSLDEKILKLASNSNLYEKFTKTTRVGAGLVNDYTGASLLTSRQSSATSTFNELINYLNGDGNKTVSSAEQAYNEAVKAVKEAVDTKWELDELQKEDFKQSIISQAYSQGSLEGLTVEEFINKNPQYKEYEYFFQELWKELFPDNSELEAAAEAGVTQNYYKALNGESQNAFTDLLANGVDEKLAFENLNAIENLSSAYEAQNEILEDLVDTYELLGREDRLENLIQQGEIISNQIENLKAQQQSLRNIYNGLAKDKILESFALFDYTIEDAAGLQALTYLSRGEEIDADIFANAQAWAEKVANSDDYSQEQKAFAATLMSMLTNYQGLATEIANNIEEAARKKLETNLKEFDMELQVKIEKESIKRDFGEFERELADDDDYAIHMRLVEMDIDSWASELETLTGKGGPLDKLLKMDASKLINDMNELGKIEDGQISKAQYQTKIEEYRQLIQENILNIKEAMESLDEMAVDAQEKLNDLYEKQIDYLNTAIKLMENRFKLNKLITGADRQNSDDLKAVAAQYKEIYAIQTKRFKEMETEYKNLDKNDHSERAEQIRDLYFQLAQDASDTYTTMVEAYKTAYEQELVEIIESSFGIAESTLAQLKEEQEWISKGAEHFLDSTDEAYQNEKLAYEYRKAMRDYQDPAIQRRLNDLMEEELDMLKEKDNVTQKDYERAQKRLELEKARIALEETQQNKTTMQLTRRSDGSYGYEYVADSDKLEDLRQNVRDLENELINWDKEALKEQLDTVESMYEEFIKGIQDAFNDDFKIDEMEEKTLRRALKTLQDYLGENEYLLQNWADSLGVPVEELANWTDEQFADANISKGMFDLFNALNNGDMGAAFEAILRDGAAAADFLEELGITFDENGKLKSTQLDDLKPVEEDAKAEYTTLTDEITAQKDALSDLDTKLKETKGIYDSLSTAAVKLCGAMAEVNNLAAGNGTGKNAYSVDKIDQYLTNLHTRLQNIPPIATYDTGGYTGAWGSGGKLLLAHEKELILNQEDTQNILNAVNIVRSLESSMFGGLAQLALEGHRNIADIIEGQDFEQNVYITAQFPEATDRDEITEAFRDMVNLATQHVFENNKT